MTTSCSVKPAAVGKLFSEQMWTLQSAGTEVSPCAKAASLTEAKQEANLPVVALSSTPLSQILSAGKSLLAVTLVLACICSLFRVTLTESFNGRINCSSRLPPKMSLIYVNFWPSEQFKLVWFKQHWTQMHLLIIWSITFHVCSILCDNLDWM